MTVTATTRPRTGKAVEAAASGTAAPAGPAPTVGRTGLHRGRLLGVHPDAQRGARTPDSRPAPRAGDPARRTAPARQHRTGHQPCCRQGDMADRGDGLLLRHAALHRHHRCPGLALRPSPGPVPQRSDHPVRRDTARARRVHLLRPRAAALPGRCQGQAALRECLHRRGPGHRLGADAGEAPGASIAIPVVATSAAAGSCPAPPPTRWLLRIARGGAGRTDSRPVGPWVIPVQERWASTRSSCR